MLNQKRHHPLLSSITSEDMSDGQQHIETHLIGQTRATNVLIVFEHFLVWLLALEPSWVRCLNIVGSSSRSECVTSITTSLRPGDIVDRLLHCFGQNKMTYLGNVTKVVGKPLCLVSGSLNYSINSRISAASSSLPTRVIGVVHHHFHGRLRNGRPSGVLASDLPNWNCWTSL
jgi:hypothetical protein